MSLLNQLISNKKHIIWDWNGTMLDDTELCVECMNKVLRNHKIKEIDINKYRETFTFPVKDYYEAIGFDFSKINFEKPALEFIEAYYSNIDKAGLVVGVREALSLFKQHGFTQHCLSAMEHQELVNSLTAKGIIDYFSNIRGISDHYAHSKTNVGHSLLKTISASKNEILMIGDTIHDFEVANDLGIECLLISNGHQSEERLKKVTKNIISDINELLKFF